MKDGSFRFGKRVLAGFTLVALHSFARPTEFAEVTTTYLRVVWALCIPTE